MKNALNNVIESFFSIENIKNNKSNTKEKDVENFPLEKTEESELSLADMADRFSACQQVSKSAISRSLSYKKKIKDFLLKEYCHEWCQKKFRPKTKTWKTLKSKLDYVMTSFISINADKKKKLDENNFEIKKHIEMTKIVIDVKKLQSNKQHLKTFLMFLETMDEKDRDAIFEKNYAFRDGFFDNLGEICNFDKERLYLLLSILEPRTMFNNVRNFSSESQLFEEVSNIEF